MKFTSDLEYFSTIFLLFLITKVGIIKFKHKKLPMQFNFYSETDINILLKA